MRARIVELDGTPDEVAQVLAQVQDGTVADSSARTSTGSGSDLPGELHEWFRFWDVRNPQRQYTTEVVESMLALGDVEVRILGGRGDDRFSGRIRLVRSGQREAFGILGRRGILYLQLPMDFDVSSYSHARRRDTKKTRHPVRMFVRSPEAVKEAVALLRAAHDHQANE